ncbi:MAG: UDP-3-O-(3-hydroxymyristoyl)glucosamine N-acyltransferase [Phycisphaerales bacterium]|nr:UDP-3-O-(3-hydroxymyristoyl)glucosamine N-acyltransferase [Phycisphaerales bacterium]
MTAQIPPATPHTTGSIAAAIGAQLIGPADLPISTLETLDRAGPTTMTFIRSAAYARDWGSSSAAAALISQGLAIPGHDPARRALLVVPDADLALIKVLGMFEPKPTATPGRHAGAIIDPSAQIAATAQIGAGCVVEAGVTIGEGTVLMTDVTVGADSRIGPACRLHPGVVLYPRTVIGAGGVLHANAVIGADGFGYRPREDGRGLIKIPHIGNVEIGQGVEIGACSCIDRGKFGATVIGDGTKIDNHCQIGHNCRIGRSVIICGMCGMGGSTTIGDGVIIAGHVGVADNLTVGAGARIAAKSAVMQDVPAGESWFGYPAQPAASQMRAVVALRSLPAFMRSVRKALNLREG